MAHATLGTEGVHVGRLDSAGRVIRNVARLLFLRDRLATVGGRWSNL